MEDRQNEKWNPTYIGKDRSWNHLGGNLVDQLHFQIKHFQSSELLVISFWHRVQRPNLLTGF